LLKHIIPSLYSNYYNKKIAYGNNKVKAIFAVVRHLSSIDHRKIAYGNNFSLYKILLALYNKKAVIMRRIKDG